MAFLSLRHGRRPAAAVLSALLVVASAMAAGCGVDFALRAEQREEWKRSYPLNSGGVVEIHNTNGRILVEPGDGPTVEIVAQKIARASTDERAKDALTNLKIRESSDPNRVVIESSLGMTGFHFNLSVSIEYTVRVPKSAGVKLVATNGEIEARGLDGLFEARTTNGRVRAKELSGGADVETTNGAVVLEMSTVAERGVTCETTNGSIEVAVPRDSGARLEVNVTNGGIEVDGLPIDTTEKSRRRLEASIGGGGPLIKLQATNGRVSVRGR